MASSRAEAGQQVQPAAAVRTCGANGRWKLSSRPCCSSAEDAVVRRSPTMARSSAWRGRGGCAAVGDAAGVVAAPASGRGGGSGGGAAAAAHHENSRQRR